MSELAPARQEDALTAQMYAQLAAARRGRQDPQARVVLLHGAPTASLRATSRDFLKRPAGGSSRRSACSRCCRTWQKPVVAAVGGPAVGIGSTLLRIELRIPPRERAFPAPFVPLASSGVRLDLPPAVARRLSGGRELLLLGHPSARRSYEVGIVTQVS